MTRSRLAVLAILLTALFAGPAGAADEATLEAPAQAQALEEAAPALSAVTPEGEQAGCGTAAAIVGPFGGPLTEMATQAALITCNCNSNRDCEANCEEEGGGTCFIGPVCSNFPDFTGTCLCKKDAEPFPGG